jgi:hypothetical protein
MESYERQEGYDRLRQLGSRLLALASTAQDQGRHEFAKELGRLAAEAHDLAFAMEKWPQKKSGFNGRSQA